MVDLRQVQTALEMNFDSTGSYPATISVLVTNKFLPAEPKDPSTQAIYSYTPCPGNMSYTLGALLENGGTAPTTGPLVTDIDTALCGTASCADPVYCVQP